jgi:hypothetical protein
VAREAAVGVDTIGMVVGAAGGAGVGDVHALNIMAIKTMAHIKRDML